MTTTPNKTSDHVGEVLKNLNEMRKRKEFCDFAVIVNKKRFVCHRLVLISTSEYFRSLFTTGIPRDVSTFTTLKNVDCATFETLLDYAYSEELKITESNAFKLLKAGDFLRMKKVVEACVQYIKNNPKMDNLLEICLYARNSLNNLDLADAMGDFIANKLDTLLKNPLVMTVPFDILDSILCRVKINPVVCSMCSHYLRYHTKRNNFTGMFCDICSKQCPDTMEELFAVLVKWIEHKVMERMKFFPQLAAYSGLPASYLSPFKSLLALYEEAWKTKCSNT